MSIDQEPKTGIDNIYVFTYIAYYSKKFPILIHKKRSDKYHFGAKYEILYFMDLLILIVMKRQHPTKANKYERAKLNYLISFMHQRLKKITCF